MGAFLLVALTAAPCFLADDPSPGWKQVILPNDAPSLAAPAAVEQFRSEGMVTIVDERAEIFLAGERTWAGPVVFDLELGAGGRSLEVQFVQPLRGAKVDVTARGPSGTMTLLREQRVGADTLKLTWGTNEVERVSIRVHSHLRKEPIVRSLTSVRVRPASSLPLASGFTHERSLFYLQPAGPRVMLCDDARQPQWLRPNSPDPRAVPRRVGLSQP
jgi:hypothetical protein